MVRVKREHNGQIPYRPATNEAVTMGLHPMKGTGVIVKIQPPLEPSIPQDHVPCDIVLVIDVSGSMTADAPVPTKPGEEVERTGLSVLDLTKHAARTIVETLNENDRLAIVTFAGASTVLQKLLHMTEENKKITDSNIESMQPKDATNLWHGIRDGLKLFNDEAKDDYGKPERIPALMVLTDGCPNHMCPTQGYVPKLRSMGKLPATINTFGFGYNLRSGLLKSIAEIGGGNYSFIPDAGMVGTTFIHAVANLQSTFAQNAVLRLKYPSNISLKDFSIPGLEEGFTGQTVNHQSPQLIQLQDDYSELTINLHNLQYGQSRDICLEYSPWGKSPPITATLEYQRLLRPVQSTTATLTPDSQSISPDEWAYHYWRSLIVTFLLALTPPNSTDEERTPTIPLPDDMSSKFSHLLASIPVNQSPPYTISPPCKSLLDDLKGQVFLALTNPEYYARWGVHYLPSLAGAHEKQLCNSFKDPGPLLYGSDSPLFLSCKEKLDKAFDQLPAPTPSNLWGFEFMPKAVSQAYRYRRGSVGSDTTGVATPESGYYAFSMGRYNSKDNPCFAGCARVLLAEGEGDGSGKRALTPGEEVDEPWLDGDATATRETGRMIRVGKLRAGMRVATPRGPRKVAAVLRTPVQRQDMCLVGRGLLVTPWHPVSLSAGRWEFPSEISRRKVRYTGSIYSVLLERDEDPEAHAVFVGGVWGVTLGHGVVDGDMRAHEFFGDYTKVVRSLGRLHRNRNGLVLGGGVRRDERTGLVDGFRRLEGEGEGVPVGYVGVGGVKRRGAVCVV